MTPQPARKPRRGETWERLPIARCPQMGLYLIRLDHPLRWIWEVRDESQRDKEDGEAKFFARSPVGIAGWMERGQALQDARRGFPAPGRWERLLARLRL